MDDLRDLLLASMQNTISLTELATQQATKISAITTSLTEAKTEIDQLKSKINKLEEGQTEQNEKLNGTTVEIIGLTSELATALTKMEDFKNESQTEVEALNSEVSKSQSNVESLESELKKTIDDLTVKVEENSWPEGSYCILGSGGSCPEGFTRHQGWTKAIWTWKNSNGLTQAATFGDSRIGCHRSCSHSRTDFNTDIFITSCCK